MAVPVVLVVMGVSGSGKSTVGELLADRLGVPFADGDDLHSAENVAKMASGIPLDDVDREPWLQSIAQWVRAHAESGGVITSSALKRKYRDVLRGDYVVLVYLAGTRELFASRIAERRGHFMPAALLDSQLATLEPPHTDERFVQIDASLPPEVQTDEILDWLTVQTQ